MRDIQRLKLDNHWPPSGIGSENSPMSKFIQPIRSTLTERHAKSGAYLLPLILACAWLGHAPTGRAVTSDEDTGQSLDAPPLALVFSDDFSTDPNTNGQWTIHRNAGKRSTAWPEIG